jgi:hypothetical protein
VRYKRNQVEEAIFHVVEPTAESPSVDLRNRLKRLLDTDRSLGRNARSLDPEKVTYAFYSKDAAGSGVEVLFQEYEAFALVVGLQFLEHGFPQRKCVLALRGLRPVLEPEHARILQLDPNVLFDVDAIRRAAQPGQLAVGSTDPVFLVIGSGAESKENVREESKENVREGESIKSLKVCRGEIEMMQAVKANASSTILEIVGIVHHLHHHLSTTEPSRRGRAAS